MIKYYREFKHNFFATKVAIVLSIILILLCLPINIQNNTEQDICGRETCVALLFFLILLFLISDYLNRKNSLIINEHGIYRLSDEMFIPWEFIDFCKFYHNTGRNGIGWHIMLEVRLKNEHSVYFTKIRYRCSLSDLEEALSQYCSKEQIRYANSFWTTHYFAKSFVVITELFFVWLLCCAIMG